MTVMVIGSGGREHALALKLAESPEVGKILCAPGNGGTASVEKCENIGILGIEEQVRTALNRKVDLVVVGPEIPLVAGVADRLRAEGIPTFGPGRRAAMLEGSKVYAKDFMGRHGVRTAGSRRFFREEKDEVREYLRHAEYPLVIKADGLAAGKGVTICSDISEAEQTLRGLFEEDLLGESGHSVLIEEYLEGLEVSVLVLCDGITALPLTSAMDHKTIGEGNTGPNTGGMGVVAPNPFFTVPHRRDFETAVLEPTLRGLREEHPDFRGVIFFGLMLHGGKNYLLEYNVRFGDPETQAILPLLRDDLYPLLRDTAEGRLERRELSYRCGAACNVVVASEGYPGSYRKGLPIAINPALPERDVTLYIAGAELKGDTLYTSGGRVLSVTGLGKTIEEARQKAYTY